MNTQRKKYFTRKVYDEEYLTSIAMIEGVICLYMCPLGAVQFQYTSNLYQIKWDAG